jgi:hypothetical protein
MLLTSSVAACAIGRPRMISRLPPEIVEIVTDRLGRDRCSG